MNYARYKDLIYFYVLSTEMFPCPIPLSDLHYKTHSDAHDWREELLNIDHMRPTVNCWLFSSVEVVL